MLAFEGHKAPERVLASLAEKDYAGFTLFRYLNCETPEQVRALTGALQQTVADAGRPPLLIAADQEGGQLNAIGPPATQFAGNMALGAVRDPELAFRVGAAIGRELTAVGVNINYAPVCDINTNPENPALGIRSFSDDPHLAAAMAAALIAGMTSAGVAATAKHFPGIGAARVDSHHGLPVIDHDRTRLRAVELVPFAAAVEAGAKLVMTGHFSIPALTGSDNLPATLSRAAMHDLLRGELGFDGVTITDAFDMGAITQGAGQIVDAVAALRAGVDLLLLTADRDVQERLEAGLKLAVTRGLFDPDEFVAAQTRIARLRSWTGSGEQPALDVVGCREHAGLARELAERSLTLVRDAAGLIPLQPAPEARVLAVMPEPQDLTPADTSSTVRPALAAALRRRHPVVDEIVTAHSPTGAEIAAVRGRAAACDLVVAGTLSASLNPAQTDLIDAILSTGVQTVTVALRTPYDLDAYPRAGTHLCTYSLTPESLDALTAALFGDLSCRGVLPVSLFEVGQGRR